MTVLTIPDFEAEALDLDHVPDQDEIYPGDSNTTRAGRVRTAHHVARQASLQSNTVIQDWKCLRMKSVPISYLEDAASPKTTRSGIARIVTTSGHK